jgi:hypothetical protein
VIELLDKLAAENAVLGISSLRAYGLDERIFDKLAEVKNSSLTFAPEGGSQRMRDVINKNISEEDLIKTAEIKECNEYEKNTIYPQRNNADNPTFGRPCPATGQRLHRKPYGCCGTGIYPRYSGCVQNKRAPPSGSADCQ